ncbi:MAG: type II secretion system protein M [Gammaproteobacteria bacterium]|nr:type II secretion system protein M [Gammaproteobacteria bacterium]MBU1481549.1 type II secretion system protein M [Gammaproteobacteria bacterium]
MTIQEQYDRLVVKVDGFSLRERVLVFAAAAFLLVALVDALFLEPLLDKQKALSAQVVQQQEKMKEVQAQIAALLEAKQADANSPQRERIRLLQQKIDEGAAYLRERRDKLVPPERMAGLLEQVLNRNGRLQLVALDTLPASLLVEPASDQADEAQQVVDSEKQIYKHGVKITVRGSYSDLLGYLSALERLRTQMYWSIAKMEVIKYPTVELTLTLYTLSLDKTWLQL